MPEEVNQLLIDIKVILRVSNSAYDNEITDLIASAKKDLELTGIDSSKIVETDELIKRAIALYCKAHFGYDNADHERLIKAYDLLKGHISISVDYEVSE